MKRYIKVEIGDGICPFVGGKCIRDGWNNWDQRIAHPCMFWDGDKTYNGGFEPDNPCRIQRAVNRILSREKLDEYDGTTIAEVPW